MGDISRSLLIQVLMFLSENLILQRTLTQVKSTSIVLGCAWLDPTLGNSIAVTVLVLVRYYKLNSD